MKLIERIRKKKEIMTPLRWKVNYVWAPIYCAVVLIPLLVFDFLMLAFDGVFTLLFLVWLGILLVTALAFPWVFIKLTKWETEVELKRFAYLFEPAKALEEDCVEVEEDGVTYALNRDGVRVILPIETERVFEEANENSFFLDWRDADVAFASQTHLRRVHIALAVFDRDMEYPPLFIPMNENLYRAIKAYGLDEKMGEDWEYLQKNSQDAFKQILTKGRIVKKKST